MIRYFQTRACLVESDLNPAKGQTGHDRRVRRAKCSTAAGLVRDFLDDVAHGRGTIQGNQIYQSVMGRNDKVVFV